MFRIYGQKVSNFACMKLLCIIVGLFIVTFCKGQISCAMEEFIKRNEGLSVEVYMDVPYIRGLWSSHPFYRNGVGEGPVT